MEKKEEDDMNESLIYFWGPVLVIDELHIFRHISTSSHSAERVMSPFYFSLSPYFSLLRPPSCSWRAHCKIRNMLIIAEVDDCDQGRLS